RSSSARFGPAARLLFGKRYFLVLLILPDDFDRIEDRKKSPKPALPPHHLSVAIIFLRTKNRRPDGSNRKRHGPYPGCGGKNAHRSHQGIAHHGRIDRRDFLPGLETRPGFIHTVPTGRLSDHSLFRKAEANQPPSPGKHQQSFPNPV